MTTVFLYKLFCGTQKSVGRTTVALINSVASQLCAKAEEAVPTSSTGNTAFSPWTKLPEEAWWRETVAVWGMSIDCVLVAHAWIRLLKKKLWNAETANAFIFHWYFFFCWISETTTYVRAFQQYGLESRAALWWAQETSGSPGAPSFHRWILSLLPCSHHSTGLSSPRSKSIYWGCHCVGPRNFQLQPLPRYGYPWLPLVSNQCQHNLKERRTWACCFLCLVLISIIRESLLSTIPWFYHIGAAQQIRFCHTERDVLRLAAAFQAPPR